MSYNSQNQIHQSTNLKIDNSKPEIKNLDKARFYENSMFNVDKGETKVKSLKKTKRRKRLFTTNLDNEGNIKNAMKRSKHKMDIPKIANDSYFGLNMEACEKMPTIFKQSSNPHTSKLSLGSGTISPDAKSVYKHSVISSESSFSKTESGKLKSAKKGQKRSNRKLQKRTSFDNFKQMNLSGRNLMAIVDNLKELEGNID